MNSFLVITPDKDAIDLIYRIRKELVEKQFGNVDSRARVVPHITLSYIEQELTKQQIETVINSFKELDILKSLEIDIKEVVSWDQKIVTKFDPSLLEPWVENFRQVFERLSIKVNLNYEELYGKTIGDHMKVARCIKAEKMDSAIKFVKDSLPKKIIFEKVSFL